MAKVDKQIGKNTKKGMLLSFLHSLLPDGKARVIVDPSIPRGEVYIMRDGRVIGKIENVGKDEMIEASKEIENDA